MQAVAHHLQIKAHSLRHSFSDEADLFARSAFNRYYYGTFLCVYNCLIQVDANWQNNLSHSSIPNLLKGNISRRIREARRRAIRVSDSEMVKESEIVRGLTLELAQMVETAYMIRVVADYRPEIKVEFSSERFSLYGMKVTEAHDWIARADLWSKKFLDMLRQIDG